SVPPSIQIGDPSASGPQKFRPIFPVSATPFLPTVQDVLNYIVSLEVAVVELLPEHVEALLDLMVYDGIVEKVFVRRDEDDDLNGAPAKANGKAAKGKGKAKASGKGKRKKAADSSDESSESEDDRRSKKGKKSKRATNGKAKKKRMKFDRSSDAEKSDSESDDFNSDEEAPNKKKKKKKGGSDDESDSDDSDGGRKKSSKRRKKRDRSKKVKRSSSDEEKSDAEEEDQLDSPKKPDLDGGDGEGATGAAASGSQYVYRLIRPYEPVIGWTDMPCGRCPVEEFCAEPPRDRAVAYGRPRQVAANPTNPNEVAASVAAPLGGPKTRIELEGGIQGVGMLGGAGAAIGVSLAKWGEMKGAVGTGIAPINPKDCPYFQEWLNF
ncbi:hypothetical protein JCM10213_002135, partial [Rhodosporidiobolus nylandii]